MDCERWESRTDCAEVSDGCSNLRLAVFEGLYTSGCFQLAINNYDRAMPINSQV